MRVLDKELANQLLDTLIEQLAHDGPFTVQSDGKDVAVFVSPAFYKTLAGKPSEAHDVADPKFPRLRE